MKWVWDSLFHSFHFGNFLPVFRLEFFTAKLRFTSAMVEEGLRRLWTSQLHNSHHGCWWSGRNTVLLVTRRPRYIRRTGEEYPCSFLEECVYVVFAETIWPRSLFRVVHYQIHSISTFFVWSHNYWTCGTIMRARARRWGIPV